MNENWTEPARQCLLKRIRAVMETGKELLIAKEEIAEIFPPNAEFRDYNASDFAIWLAKNDLGLKSALQWLPSKKSILFRKHNIFITVHSNSSWQRL